MSSTSAGGNNASTSAQMRQAMLRNTQIKQAATEEKPAQKKVDKKKSLKAEKQEIIKQNSIAREGVDRSKLKDRVKSQKATSDSFKPSAKVQERQSGLVKNTRNDQAKEEQRTQRNNLTRQAPPQRQLSTDSNLPDSHRKVNFKREEDDSLYMTSGGRKTSSGLVDEERISLANQMGGISPTAKIEKTFDLKTREEGVYGMRAQSSQPKIHGGIAEDGRFIPAARENTEAAPKASEISTLYAQQIGVEFGDLGKKMPWQFAEV